MVIWRSILFNVLFYLGIAAWCIIGLPTLLMPQLASLRIAQGWGRFSLRLLRWTVGLRAEFRGLERIPPGGLLVAAKHQSFWETFALLTLFERPVFILKQELTWLPFFGWLLLKSGMIPVDRRAGAAAIGAMNGRALRAVQEGRQVIIFPEGTRRAAGAEPDYKSGVAHLYRNLKVPCLPVALNSGLFWPRRRFLRHPGTVVVECLAPIPPGLDRRTFTADLQNSIEDASNRLLAEARGETRYSGPDGI